MLLYDIWLSDGRGSMHSEFKGQMESFAELGLKEWKDLAVEKRGEDAQSNGREAECVYSIFLPASFPFFSFPKVGKYQKGFENENYGLEMCLLKYYKRNNLFFHLFHHSYSKPWIIKYV